MPKRSFIKSCAFCGLEARMEDNRKSVYLECNDCGAKPYQVEYCDEPEEKQEGQMSKIAAEKEVIRLWNRRLTWRRSLHLLIQRLRE
jgi:hypothetical protein